MSFSDRLAESQALRERPHNCPVARLLDEMPATDREACVTALADDKYSTLQIVGVLRAEGYKISRTSISEHRTNRCLCQLEEQE